MTSNLLNLAATNVLFPLNFEFNVECYGTDLNQQLAAIFEQQRQRSRAVTAEELNQRHLLLRLRDGIARLASPYI